MNIQETKNVILKLLERVNLTGAEVPTYLQVIKNLEGICTMAEENEKAKEETPTEQSQGAGGAVKRSINKTKTANTGGGGGCGGKLKRM